jgi:hypothetical protein
MPDAGLASDTCLFLNDGPAAQWWLSPDIVVNGFDGVPVPPGARTVTVTARCQARCPRLEGAPMRVELWVGNPALVLDKLNPSSSKRIGLIPETVPAAGGSKPVIVNWNVPSGGSGPDSSGHKCLIGIVYPADLTPDQQFFFAFDDDHYAQKNLCIVSCSSPCGLTVQTVNINRKEPQNVIIRAVADPKPTRELLAVVMPALKAFKGFKRLSEKLPPPVKIKLEGCPEAKITEYWKGKAGSTKYGRLSVPNAQVKIVMKPKQRVRFHVSTDLEEAPLGDAFLIHFTHNVGRKALGGLTVVFVRVKQSA